MGRSSLRRLGKTAEVEGWGSGVVGGREPTKPRRALIGGKGRMDKAEGWKGRRVTRRRSIEAHLPNIILRQLHPISSPSPTTDAGCREKSMLYFIPKSENGRGQKPTNRIERSLILLCNCTSSNPAGEKCQTTTEKGAASTRQQIRGLPVRSVIRDSTGDLPMFDSQKSP